MAGLPEVGPNHGKLAACPDGVHALLLLPGAGRAALITSGFLLDMPALVAWCALLGELAWLGSMMLIRAGFRCVAAAAP